MVSEGAGSSCIYSVLPSVMRKSTFLVAKWPKICLADHRGTIDIHPYHPIKIAILECSFQTVPMNKSVIT